MRGFGRRAALAATVLAIGAGGAAAKDEGYIVALNCGLVPAAAAVEVVPPDNAREILDVNRAVADALGRAGHPVVERGRVRVTFEIETRRDSGPARGQGVDQADIETYREGQERVRVPVWTGDVRTVFPGIRAPAQARPTDAVRFTLYVHDRDDGKCLWQGEAVHHLRGLEAWEMAIKLVPRLVPHVGKRVDQTAIDVE
ncbi:MAG: hypothetical protein FJX67_12395 [Alphaproteobacteria bacterium]|nr:hypothetical protein [Alphaproteobacteria bacterium]